MPNSRIKTEFPKRYIKIYFILQKDLSVILFSLSRAWVAFNLRE